MHDFVLSSPNRMLWQYYKCLKRLEKQIETLKGDDEKKQGIVVCVFMAITVIETFLNLFFRVVVSEKEFLQQERQVRSDLECRKSLEHKIRKWPKAIFGESINFDSGIGKEFMELKNKRNSLMHFTSGHETISVPGVEIQGLANTAVYDDLKIEDARSAINIVEELVKEIFRLRGVEESKVPLLLHSWMGKIHY